MIPITEEEIEEMVEKGDLLSRAEYAKLNGWTQWDSMQEQNYVDYYCDEDRDTREDNAIQTAEDENNIYDDLVVGVDKVELADKINFIN